MRDFASTPTCMPGGASPFARDTVRGRACASSLIGPPESNTGKPMSCALGAARAGHARSGRNAGRYERIAADHRAFADHGLAAEDRGVRVDHHVVLERGVPALARLGPLLALGHREC